VPYHELNLSSKPYRDYRGFLLVIVAIYAVTLCLSWLTVRQLSRRLTLTERTSQRVQKLEKDIAAAKIESGRLSQTLAAINFKEIHEAGGILNGLIAQRTFSWSLILESLQRVLPEDVRLSFLGTSAGKDGMLVLHLSCISSTRDGMVRTVEALQKDPVFTRVLPLSYQDEEAHNQLGKKFEIEAWYGGGRP
jgi:hypothetical protein